MVLPRRSLVGLNWTRNNEEPRSVKWSTEAFYGNPPSTWDEQDATLEAGEYELSDTPGDFIDGLPLGDPFIILRIWLSCFSSWPRKEVFLCIPRDVVAYPLVDFYDEKASFCSDLRYGAIWVRIIA